MLMFPAAHALLARRMDHGRAGAALLALYGASLITRSVAEEFVR